MKRQRPIRHGPIDFEQLLPRLDLTIGQVARLAGISVRQVSYWTAKGILTATNPKKRVYNADALRKAILINRALEDGLSLGEAVGFAEAEIEAQERERERLESLGRRGMQPYLLSRLEDLERLANRVRRALPALDAEGREHERNVAMTQLEIVDFFSRNPDSRNTTSRIATQIGRTVELVESALDELCRQQHVERYISGGRTVSMMSDRRNPADGR